MPKFYMAHCSEECDKIPSCPAPSSLGHKSSVCPVYMCYICYLPVDHLVAGSVIRSPVTVSQHYVQQTFILLKSVITLFYYYLLLLISSYVYKLKYRYVCIGEIIHTGFSTTVVSGIHRESGNLSICFLGRTTVNIPVPIPLITSCLSL
jgi:hypothetical protein